MTEKGKTRSELKREAIIEAARRAFEEFGVQGTSMDKLAEMAGVSKRTVYNHFASKEELYAAVLDRTIVPVLELLDYAVEHGPLGDLDPGAMVEQVTDLLATRPHLPKLLLHETLSGGKRRQWSTPLSVARYRGGDNPGWG